jgi:DNA-directed RNA polymerase specialized sigma24 family protein
MGNEANSSRSGGGAPGTLWSVVIAAGSTDSVVARPALQQLCSIYWYPLYSYVRRQGLTPADAEDITQSFFASLIEYNGLRGLDRAKGRFRAFLLASIRNHINNTRAFNSAQKRGAGRELISLDAALAEHRFSQEPVDTAATPERMFDRQWAITLLDRSLGRLRAEYCEDGKGALFDALQDTLAGGEIEGGYARISGGLGMSEGAVKVSAHRLRQRYREVIREEVAATTAVAGDTEDELRELFAALAT